MRYDGAARRSQRGNPSVIDRIWSFFSSVKIAVYLIIITIIGASVGTIFPQEDIFLTTTDLPAYYRDTYGTLGSIYYKLGLSHTYESWWFILLLVMIGTSLVICSLDRVLPLYRALNKQQILKHEAFLSRQRTVFSGELEGSPRGVAGEVRGPGQKAALSRKPKPPPPCWRRRAASADGGRISIISA